MKKTAALSVAAFGLSAMLGSPTGAFAGTGSAPSRLTLSVSEGVTWVQLHLEAGDHSDVSIKIFKVRKRRDRLWQRCDLNYSGAGTYRCGLDSSRRPFVRSERGRWIAEALVDDLLIARQEFTL
ncbi:MAG: hypothetical protein M3N53_14325 [Actinomycetota bacterium]|nr:hypothetical protein [Actinomycetota bacterium]